MAPNTDAKMPFDVTDPLWQFGLDIGTLLDEVCLSTLKNIGTKSDRIPQVLQRGLTGLRVRPEYTHRPQPRTDNELVQDYLQGIGHLDNSASQPQSQSAPALPRSEESKYFTDYLFRTDL
jgi:hypothetical protein